MIYIFQSVISNLFLVNWLIDTKHLGENTLNIPCAYTSNYSCSKIINESLGNNPTSLWWVSISHFSLTQIKTQGDNIYQAKIFIVGY